MPCRGCGGGRGPVAKKTVTSPAARSAAVEYPKVRIRYEGAIGKHSVTGLATRQKYGRKSRGDIFWVQREDAEADPERMVIIGDAEGVSLASDLPKTALEIRRPTTLPKPFLEDEGVTEPIPVISPGVEAQVQSAPDDYDEDREADAILGLVNEDTGKIDRAVLMQDLIDDLNDESDHKVLPEEVDREVLMYQPDKERAYQTPVPKCPRCGKFAPEIAESKRRKYCLECSPPR